MGCGWNRLELPASVSRLCFEMFETHVERFQELQIMMVASVCSLVKCHVWVRRKYRYLGQQQAFATSRGAITIMNPS